jgi:hypothetical protein
MPRLHDVQLSVTTNEANVVLNALAHRPFIEVHQLITKLQGQAQACLAEKGNKDAELQRNKPVGKRVPAGKASTDQ